MATEYGYKLNPYRSLRTPKAINGVRHTIRTTHNPSTIDHEETLTVNFQPLGRNDVIVPRTSRLSFQLDLTSEGRNADANRTIVNNLGRAIVSKLDVELEGQEVFSLNDAEFFLCYQDLWKTARERKNAAYQGIMTEDIRKSGLMLVTRAQMLPTLQLAKLLDDLHSSRLRNVELSQCFLPARAQGQAVPRNYIQQLRKSP